MASSGTNKFNIVLGGILDQKALVDIKLQAETYFKSNPIKLQLQIDSNIKSIETEIRRVTEAANKSISSSLGSVGTPNLASRTVTPTKKSEVYKTQGSNSDITQTFTNDNLSKTKFDYESFNKKELLARKELDEAIASTIRRRKEEADLLERNQSSAINKNLEQEYMAQKKIAESVDDVATRIKNLGSEQTISKKKAKEYNDELAKIKTLPIDKQASAVKNLNQKISDGKKQAMGFGEQLKIAFSKFAIWSVATVTWYGAVNMLKKVIVEVIALDKAFTNLQMVTQYTDQQMNELRKSYINMAKEMGVTVDALTKGADEFLRAGLTAEQAMIALQASTVLSTVAQMDSGEATQNLIAIMNAYGLKANELLSIVDKMSAVDIKAATSSQELGEALRVSASSAQLAGISFDKYIGMIATVSETTRQSASTIGQSFDEYRRFSVAMELHLEKFSLINLDT